MELKKILNGLLFGSDLFCHVTYRLNAQLLDSKVVHILQKCKYKVENKIFVHWQKAKVCK